MPSTTRPRYHDLTDSELLELARTGDNRAYGELFTRYHRIARHIARATTTIVDADDLVAEAYTRIYQALTAGRGPHTAFRAYLMHTVRNIAISEARKHHFPTISDADQVPLEQTLEDQVEARQGSARLAQAFNALPQRWQEVLARVDIDNEPTASVATCLGLTRNTTAALTYRARRGLRTALELEYAGAF